jgi:hypothetical protein
MKALALIAAFALALPALAKEAPAERDIDIVVCLDTSGSMQGLIESAKQKLWDIVNELGRAKPKPHLRVGLYVYGTPGYGAQTGFVKKLVDLTDDLDTVYAKLTPLTTDGGDEYVARVVRTAVLEQPWSKDRQALKIIVVAGNEEATQDPKFKSLDIAKEAITAGIIVNTIYCGSPTDGIAPGWRDVARAADGQFASIDQNNGIVVISTPFDEKLADLSGAINKTYVAYGRHAQEGTVNQLAMDTAAMTASPAVAASRTVAKVGGQYRNARWDLVDASAEKDFSLASVKTEDLPVEMQKMTEAERKTYLDEKAKKRAALQNQVNELNRQRQRYIREQMKESGKSTDKAFDAAMLSAIRHQAQQKDFTF